MVWMIWNSITSTLLHKWIKYRDLLSHYWLTKEINCKLMYFWSVRGRNSFEMEPKLSGFVIIQKLQSLISAVRQIENWSSREEPSCSDGVAGLNPRKCTTCARPAKLQILADRCSDIIIKDQWFSPSTGRTQAIQVFGIGPCTGSSLSLPKRLKTFHS